jgi:hypothetical protein
VNAVGVVVGGIVPAPFLGLGTMLMRSSIAAGASIGRRSATFWFVMSCSQKAAQSSMRIYNEAHFGFCEVTDWMWFTAQCEAGFRRNYSLCFCVPHF